jgi:hypothetical protein
MVVLGAYFGDQSIEEGVYELMFISEESSFFETLRIIFQNALEAVEQGDKEVLDHMAEQVYVCDPEDAKNYLRDLGNEYRRQYEIALSTTQN